MMQFFTRCTGLLTGSFSRNISELKESQVFEDLLKVIRSSSPKKIHFKGRSEDEAYSYEIHSGRLVYTVSLKALPANLEKIDGTLQGSGSLTVSEKGGKTSVVFTTTASRDPQGFLVKIIYLFNLATEKNNRARYMDLKEAGRVSF